MSERLKIERELQINLLYSSVVLVIFYQNLFNQERV